jgi:hypothetical protein
MTCEDLVTALQEALGPNLQSVVLYGSAAAGDFVPGLSGHDVLIIADRLGSAELTALSDTLVIWERSGNPLPQLFTLQELAAATDVFPIELLDMQQSRRVLFGKDPLATLTIDMGHYRNQLERELKVRLQLLRRRYVACAGDGERVAHLMATSVSTFLVLLRAVLRLYNESVPTEKADVLGPLAEHLKYDPQPLHEVLELRTYKNIPTSSEVESLFGRYLQSIEQVVHSVDRYLHPSPTGDVPLPEKSHE